MDIIANSLRGRGIRSLRDLKGLVAHDPGRAQDLFSLCPKAREAPLIEVPGLARRGGFGKFFVKDETDRMGLGSFKALGAFHAIARLAADRVGAEANEDEFSSALSGSVFACASAGNHGLSVAAGARVFGARAVVYISETVSEGFARRLRAKGAEVVRSGQTYEESMLASVRAADEDGWTLLSDSSWDGYHQLPASVMEGYLISGAEVVDHIPATPSHIFLQAGVGGFAASMTALFRSVWGDDPMVIVVEPESARCLTDSVVAGEPVLSPGPVSSMGRLDCKEASLLALAVLSADANYFVTIDDEVAERAVDTMAGYGIVTTPSGAAGIAAALATDSRLGITPDSRCLAFVTEGA